MEARKREMWPWRSARGAMSTGGIFVYLRPREEADDAFPVRSLVYGRYSARYRPTKTQNGSKSVAMTVGMKEKMIWETSCMSERIGKPNE